MYFLSLDPRTDQQDDGWHDRKAQQSTKELSKEFITREMRSLNAWFIYAREGNTPRGDELSMRRARTGWSWVFDNISKDD